ncbi:MAG TPA: PaaI family thioesterase [Bacillota bacterium]
MTFSERIGIEKQQAADGHSVIEIEIDDRHLNRRGIAHGGVLCSLLDDTIGMAVHSLLGPAGAASTADLTVYFLRPVLPGRLRGEGRVLRRGRRLIVGEGTLFDGEGRPVAHGVGSWAVLRDDAQPADGRRDDADGEAKPPSPQGHRGG